MKKSGGKGNKGAQKQMFKQIPPGPKSWSGLYAWSVCKLQYWFQYGEKIPSDKGLPAKFGTAFHDYRFRYFDRCRQIDKDSDWDSVEPIAHQTFHDAGLPIEYWDEFLAMARGYAESKSYNPKMLIEHRFGINRDGTVGTFESCDGFRGILDGLEVTGDTGVVTDTKTSQTMDLAWSQIEIYAAFMSLIYPDVKEWRLVYDFPRFRKTKEKTVLAENLGAVRKHVWSIVDRIDSERHFKPQPSEACLTCPALGICEYRLRGVEGIEDQDNARAAIEEYWQLKARAEQIKRLLKKFVTVTGSVATEKSKAAFYDRETKTCDKVELVKFLKKVGKNPMDYVTVPAESLKTLMHDKTISDDIGNLISIETKPVFDIKKIKEGDDGEDEG
jgi:hypothetical protein